MSYITQPLNDPSRNTGGAGNILDAHTFDKKENDESHLSVFPQTPPPLNQSVKKEQSEQTSNTQEARKSRVTSFFRGGAKVLIAPTLIAGLALALPAVAIGAFVIGVPAAIADKISSKKADGESRTTANDEGKIAKLVKLVNHDAKPTEINTSNIIGAGAKTAGVLVLYPQEYLRTYVAGREMPRFGF